MSLLVAGGVARPLLLSCHTVHSRFHYPTGRRCGKSKFAPPVVLLQRLREASFERDQVSLPFLLFLRKVITRNILRARIFPSRFFNRRRITTLVYTHTLFKTESWVSISINGKCSIAREDGASRFLEKMQIVKPLVTRLFRFPLEEDRR